MYADGLKTDTALCPHLDPGDTLSDQCTVYVLALAKYVDALHIATVTNPQHK